MARHIARYSVSNGLSGCYMPDSSSGPYEFATRKALAEFIRYEIEFLGWPANMFEQVRIRNLWRFIARNGSSVAHFSLERGGYSLSFHGLTKDEFNEMEKESEV